MSMNADGSRQSYALTDASKPDNGEILITCRWKQTAELSKNGKKAPNSLFVSAPSLSLELSSEHKDWFDFCSEAVQDYQRSRIQAYLSEAIEASGMSAPVVPGEFFDLEFLLAMWTEEQEAKGTGARGRLSGDQIKWFFDDFLVSTLGARIAEKKGFNQPLSEAQAKQIGQSIAQYKVLFLKLATDEVLEAKYLLQAQTAMGLVDRKQFGVIGGKIERVIERKLKVGEVELDDLL